LPRYLLRLPQASATAKMTHSPNTLECSLNTISQLYAIAKFIAKHPLNANHKLQALTNFVKWQIATRILKKKVIVPWVEDSMFISGLGETGLTGNLYAGFMEYEDMIFLLHALQPNETFVDVGANIGAYTILASKVVKSNSIAFEPLPATAERLKDQIQINRINAAVDIRNMGVGDKEGSLFFTNNNDTVNKVSLAGEVENTTMVKVSTLDNELAKDNQYFFKIDVEGFEYNVIEGASAVLSNNNVSAIIIELNGNGEEFGHSNEDIHKKLLSFGFFAVAYEPQTRNLTELKSYNQNGGNTIYVKDVALISKRCKSAPKRVVHTACDIKI
jgi:FkbM family methyltransferase